MAASQKSGLLLINLGTPASPRPADVRRYLREFLSDPRVLDLPPLERALVLNLFILPFRPRRSGAAYAQIWSPDGSPLLFHSESLARKVRARLGERVQVELAMRYGQPSIGSALSRLRAEGVDRIVAFPLYPQYSSAATGSSVEEVFRCAARLWNVPSLQIVPAFYDHPAFLDACAAVARPHLEELRPERVFFSFHGLPERQVRKGDDTGSHCLERDDCCARIGTANRNCYRAQCCSTARLLAERLGVPEERRIVCFQSRLLRDPWIRPYTDELLAAEARAGGRKALILSPAFVADCLETLEELAIRGVQTWKRNGGETLRVVPCLNADDRWVEALLTIARETTSWLGSASAATQAPGLPAGSRRSTAL
jgi:ferrochelatase